MYFRAGWCMMRTGDSALSVWMALGGALAALLRMELIAEQNDALAASFAQYRRCGFRQVACLPVFASARSHHRQESHSNTAMLAIGLAATHAPTVATLLSPQTLKLRC